MKSASGTGRFFCQPSIPAYRCARLSRRQAGIPSEIKFLNQKEDRHSDGTLSLTKKIVQRRFDLNNLVP